MKQVIKYQSDKGTVFDTPEEAIRDDTTHALELLAENSGSYHVNNNASEVAEFIIGNFNEICKILKK